MSQITNFTHSNATAEKASSGNLVKQVNIHYYLLIIIVFIIIIIIIIVIIIIIITTNY